MTDPSAASAHLDRAIDAAVAQGAEDVEVSYAGSELLFYRFASSRFTQVGAVRDDSIRVRALIDGRLGAITTARTDADSLAAAGSAAIAAARTAPPLGLALSFAGSDDQQSFADIDLGDAADPQRAPSALSDAFRKAADAGAECAGSLKTTRTHRAVRSASGTARAGSEGFVDLQFIALRGSSSGFAACAGASADAFAPMEVASRAVDTAVRGADPLDLAPGAYDVVLAPEAVSELLEWMSMASFHGAAVLDGTSLLAGRSGHALFDPRITITDAAPATAIPFDTEGVTRTAVSPVAKGIAQAPVSDRLTALRLAARNLGDGVSTGHACAMDDPEQHPFTGHLALEAGEATADGLIGSVKRGLYVTRFHYVNGLLDTRAATMTGMTRDGTFLIENGAIGKGVRNLRFTDSMVDAWKNRLGGISRETRCVPSWWIPGGRVTAPTLWIRDFQFTGTSG